MVGLGGLEPPTSPYQSGVLMPTTPIVRPFHEYGKLSSQIVPRYVKLFYGYPRLSYWQILI